MTPPPAQVRCAFRIGYFVGMTMGAIVTALLFGITTLCVGHTCAPADMTEDCPPGVEAETP